MSDLIESFKDVAPYINELTINDTAVYITDGRKYLMTIPGETIDLGLRAGDTIPEGTVIMDSLKKNIAVRKRVPESVMGVPYVACSVPLHEGNKIIGGVIFVTSIKQQEKFEGIASAISDGIVKVYSSSEFIEDGAEKMVSIYHELHELSNVLSSSISETDSILKLIDNFAKQTNLLGLNASVEAARAGNAGKGFSIIASEIRRLANNISDSAKKIEETFEKIKNASSNQLKAISSIQEVVLSQKQSVSNVNEQVENLKHITESLIASAQDLSNSGSL